MTPRVNLQYGRRSTTANARNVRSYIIFDTHKGSCNGKKNKALWASLYNAGPLPAFVSIFSLSFPYFLSLRRSSSFFGACASKSLSLSLSLLIYIHIYIYTYRATETVRLIILFSDLFVFILLSWSLGDLLGLCCWFALACVSLPHKETDSMLVGKMGGS